MAQPITILRTIAAAPQVAIQMDNGLFARSLSIPSGWSIVRLGCRLHMTDSGAALPGTPTFFMGLCKGTTNVYGDASAVHAAGIGSVSLGGNGGNRGATFYFSNFTQPSKQVGAVVTNGTDMSAAHKWTVGNQAGVADDVGCVFLTITKGSPLYSFQTYWNFSATPTQISLADFLTVMQQPVPGGLTNYEFSNVQTLAVDEATDGVFDAINFYYTPTLARMEICSVAFCLLA